MHGERNPPSVSLDPGNSTTFDVHVGFLGADHYGVENLTNLDQIPPRGADVFAGRIPWDEGSVQPLPRDRHQLASGPCTEPARRRVTARW